MTTISRKKKIHNWMSGFFPAKRLDDAELARAETVKKICDDHNKIIQNRAAR